MVSPPPAHLLSISPLSSPFALPLFFFFFIQNSHLYSPTIHPAVFGTCSFREAPLRNANIHSRAPSGGSGNLVMLRFLSVVSRSLFCLFIRLFNSPPASDRFRNVICQRLWSAMYPRKYTSDGNARRRRVQSDVALSQYHIVKILPATKSVNRG